MHYGYALEQLYVDQNPDLVIDAIPAVLAWLSPREKAGSDSPFELAVELALKKRSLATLALRWDLHALIAHDPQVEARARRMRSGRTPLREHTPEVAAYGLALVAISVLLPGRRVMAWSRWSSPDLLFDGTAGALRGVEVAGRSAGGWSALRAIVEGTKAARGKRATLLENEDVAEAYLSLWCASPRISMMLQVK